MCWYKEDWNYHPSLPMKRLQQVQDIVDVGGNVLLWSCLGSGAIGLPYLDREANDEVPPRLRFYGFLNDREFCEECAKRGITVYGVVWKAQLWEFPAEYGEDGSLVALNKLPDKGSAGWLGMRELSTNQCPGLFRPMDDFFPEGIFNSEGERIGDFLEEFRVKALDGGPVFSRWLMVPWHDHLCYTPCGNNPAYIEYLKREIEMMIDAGAGGILIDEPDTQVPAALVFGGGCFCKDCIKGFREYLKGHPSAETEGLDLDRFDYQELLKERGYTAETLLTNRATVPLYRQFIQFNLEGVERNMAELAEHVRVYSAKTRGKALPVSANMVDCLPHAAVLRKHCDFITGEKEGYGLRQDGFYRLGSAFAQGKDASFVEAPNPYITRVVDDIGNGRNDSYILLMMEPLAHGFNIAIPYGAWLMHLRKDSFWPDMRVERAMGSWLKAHERLFTNRFEARTALLYDHRAALQTEIDMLCGQLADTGRGGFSAFHDLTQGLCNQHVLYNVLFVSDDEPLTADRLEEYDTLILPDATRLTDGEVRNVQAWAAGPRRAATVGNVHPQLQGLPPAPSDVSGMAEWILQAGQAVVAGDVPQVGISLQKTDGGYALHLVNYSFDEERRCVEPVPAMSFRLAFEPKRVEVHAFPESQASVEFKGNVLKVMGLGIYTVVEMVM